MAIFTRNKSNGAASSAEAVPNPDPDEFAARWQEAWNSRAPDRVLELCTEDVIWDDPLTTEPERGHAAVRAYLENAWRAFPDMTFTYPESAYRADGGHRVALHWHVSATMLGTVDPPGLSPTRKSFEADGVDLLTLRDGKVASYRGFFDRQSTAEQLGLMPAPGSRGEKVALHLQRTLAKLRR